MTCAETAPESECGRDRTRQPTDRVTDRSGWAKGRQAAEHHVLRTRRAYERCLEAAELMINRVGVSSSRSASVAQTASGLAHESLWQVSEGWLVVACAAQKRLQHLHERGHAAVQSDFGRRRTALRMVAQQWLIASDTNIRAGFAWAERSAQASDVEDFVTIQNGFLREQSHRSMQQAIAFQSLTNDLARRAVFACSA